MVRGWLGPTTTWLSEMNLGSRNFLIRFVFLSMVELWRILSYAFPDSSLSYGNHIHSRCIALEVPFSTLLVENSFNIPSGVYVFGIC